MTLDEASWLYMGHFNFFLYLICDNLSLVSLFQQTLCSEINEECRFAVKCWGPSEKPVKLPIMNGHAGNIEDLESSEALKSMTMDTSFT